MGGDDGGGGGGGGSTESFAPTETQYVPAKVSVWWDLENCHVPRGCEPHLIAKNISSALVTMNYCGPVSISAYGDTTKIGSSIQQALNSTGISLNHVPAGAKDASDKKILVDMLFWAVDNPAPANYLLISGDRDFSNALHQLRMRRYNILLAQPTQASIHLVAAAKNVWLWSSLVTGGPPLTNKEVALFIRNTSGSTSTSNAVTESTQISQSGDSSRENLPQGNQRSTNTKGSDTKNKGRSITQPTISSTRSAVSGSQDNYNHGNPQNLGYGFPNMTNDSQNFSGNPNSTVQIQGSTPFFHTNRPDAFSNNGSNHQGYFENPYHMSMRPQAFPMQPAPPPPPNFMLPLSHVHSMPSVPLRPNTFTFTAGPVKNSPNSNKQTAGPNNQSFTNGLQRSHTLPNTAGPNNQPPMNGPWTSHTFPNTAGFSNQPPFNGPHNGYTVANATGSDNQSTINRSQKVYTAPSTVGSNNQLPNNGPQKGFFTVPNAGGFNNQLPSNGAQNGFTVANNGGFNNQLPSNWPQNGFTGPNASGSNNQVPTYGPQKGFTGPNTAGSNNQLPKYKPRKNSTVPSTAGSSNQLPSNELQKGLSGPNTAGSSNQLPSFGPQKDYTEPNTENFNNQLSINGPQKGNTDPNTASSSNQSSVNGPLNGIAVPNTAGSDNQSTINGSKKGKTGPNTAGSNNQLPSNGPQKSFTVSNSSGSNNQLPVDVPQKDNTAPNTSGSDNKLVVNKPQERSTVPKSPSHIQRKPTGRWCPVGKQNRAPVSSGTPTVNVPSSGLLVSSVCPEPNEYVQGLIGVVLLALDTLKNEKIMPTEENIVHFIKYGDPKYRKTDFKKALESAVEQQLVVKQNLGALQLYVGKDEKLWKCINLIGGNVDEYSESVWGEVQKFLSSAAGRDAILSTECSYEAATIIKRDCLKELALGEILKVLHMVIDDKKWIIPHHSGWQPVKIITTFIEPPNPVGFWLKMGWGNRRQSETSPNTMNDFSPPQDLR